MMRYHLDLNILKRSDEATEQRIAEEFPAQWDMETLFQRSFRNYLERSGAPVTQTRRRPLPYYLIGTAASLLLIVGLGAGIWSRQQPIETIPPQEPAAFTETTTETTAAETKAQTTQTRPHTETRLSPTEAPTEAPAASTGEPEPETALPQTAPAVMTQAAPETAAPAAAAVSQAPAPVTEPVPVTEAEPATETEPATEAALEISYETLTGFCVMRYPTYRQVICTDSFPAPTGELESYEVEGVSLLHTEDTAEAEPVRSYEIEAGGKVFTVTQREYAEFVLDVEEGDLIDISLNRAHGFFWLEEERCSLYWFRNGEGFYVSGDVADLRELMAIARSFTPAEQTD